MKQNFFAVLLITGFITTSIFFSCSKSSSSGGNTNTNTGSTATISMTNMTFSPKVDTVAKGTVVTWTNNDGNAHTATSDDGSTFSSGNLNGGQSFKFTANTAGTFTYYCVYHQSMGMTGTLVVKP